MSREQRQRALHQAIENLRPGDFGEVAGIEVAIKLMKALGPNHPGTLRDEIERQLGDLSGALG